jgi:hypothetical protein
MSEEGEFKRKIDTYEIRRTIYGPITTNDVGLDKVLLKATDVVEMIEVARKDLFPLPFVTIISDPETGDRDIVQMSIDDWMNHITTIRKWFGNG